MAALEELLARRQAQGPQLADARPHWERERMRFVGTGPTPTEAADGSFRFSFADVGAVPGAAAIGLEPLILQERSGADSCTSTGKRVWDCSVLLARYCEHRWGPHAPVKGLRVLELGAGQGLVGLVLGRLGARVTLTDLPSVVGNLEHNIIRNNLTESCSASALEWGKDDLAPWARQEFDVIVAADAAWLADHVDPFLEVVRTLARPSTEVLVACCNERTGTVRLREVLCQQEGDAQRQSVGAPFVAARVLPDGELHPDYTTDRITVWTMSMRGLGDAWTS